MRVNRAVDGPAPRLRPGLSASADAQQPCDAAVRPVAAESRQEQRAAGPGRCWSEREQRVPLNSGGWGCGGLEGGSGAGCSHRRAACTPSSREHGVAHDHVPRSRMRVCAHAMLFIHGPNPHLPLARAFPALLSCFIASHTSAVVISVGSPLPPSPIYATHTQSHSPTHRRRQLAGSPSICLVVIGSRLDPGLSQPTASCWLFEAGNVL